MSEDSEVSMDDVIDRVMMTFAMMRNVNDAQFEASRIKLANYIDELTSAGQHDKQRLAVQGLAYMRELHETSGVHSS
jgi:hypothetical protein